jgi:hypothetical protein
MKTHTGIDGLINLLKQEKDISLAKAAEELGSSKDTVQKWADFLVEENVVLIHYNFMKPYLTLLDPEGRPDTQHERKILTDLRTRQKKFIYAVKTRDGESAKKHYEKIKTLIDKLDDDNLKTDLKNEIIGYPEKLKKIGVEAPQDQENSAKRKSQNLKTNDFASLFERVKRLSRAGRIREAQQTLLEIKQAVDRRKLTEHSKNVLKEKVAVVQRHLNTIKQLQRTKEA